MRILHVGNFGRRPKGAFLHSVAPKLSRGLVRLGHQVVDFDDRETARAGTPFGSRRLGVIAVNRALRAMAEEMRPDLLLLGHADTIRPRLIAQLRAALPGMRVLQWNVDPMFEPDNVARIRSKLEVVDATLVSTAGEALAPLRRPGMRLGFLPNPVDLSVESGENHLRPQLPNHLFFACGHPSRPKRWLAGAEWDMEVLLRQVAEAVPGLRGCYAGLFGEPHLTGSQYQRSMESCAAGLNASRRNDVLLYSSDRLAHMIGNGQAILIDRASQYDRLFGDDQMAFFTDLDGLVRQLRRLIEEPAARQAMAAAGRSRYVELFNETLVAGYVLGVAFDAHDSARYPWPSLLA